MQEKHDEDTRLEHDRTNKIRSEIENLQSVNAEICNLINPNVVTGSARGEQRTNRDKDNQSTVTKEQDCVDAIKKINDDLQSVVIP